MSNHVTNINIDKIFNKYTYLCLIYISNNIFYN